MKRRVPGLKEALRGAVRWLRERGHDERHTVAQAELGDVPPVQDLLQRHVRELIEHQGWSVDDACADADMLGAHLFALVNYELHRRKTFWVDESLAWMLSQTDLDIAGEHLRLPFPSCAFAFTDPHTLAIASAFLARQTAAAIAGGTLSILTVHLTRIPAPPGMIGVNATLEFDADSGGWPYLFSRDLVIRPDADLDAILRSHFPEVSGDRELYEAPELLRLLALVLNAVLYTITATIDPIVLRTPVGRRSAGSGPVDPRAQAKRWSSQDVFHLPGKIDISAIRSALVDAGERGGEVAVRFVVRGHWRKANPSWTDQRLRWIEPYWKGPADAPLVEREYRVKP